MPTASSTGRTLRRRPTSARPPVGQPFGGCCGVNASADYSVKHFKGRFNAYQRTYIINVDEKALSYEYARLALEYLLSDLKRFSKGTNTKYLTLGILNRMELLLPALDDQTRFTTFVKAIDRQKAAHRAHLAELDTLFASLQSRAFRGEL